MYTNERLQNYINAGITLSPDEEKQHKEKMKQTWHFLKNSPDALANFRRDAVINRLRIIEHRLDNRRTNDPSNMLHYADREVKFNLVDATDWVEVIQGLEIPANVGVQYSQYDTTDIESEESDGEEYLAPMEDLPYSSENHIAQTQPGEILAGGMPKKHPRKKGKARSQRERGDNFSDTRHNKVRFYSQIVPDEIITRVTYTERGKLTSAGSGFASKRWTPNAPYDVDPVAGSTATIGHAEMSALYGFCTALEATGFFNVVNAENGPLGVYMIWTNNDPGTSTSFAVQAANPHGRMYQLTGASAGGSKMKIPIRKKFSQIVGSKLIETADSYRSTVTSTPADLIWLGLGIETYVPYVLTILGLEYELKLDMLVRYSGRKTLTA